MVVVVVELRALAELAACPRSRAGAAEQLAERVERRRRSGESRSSQKNSSRARSSRDLVAVDVLENLHRRRDASRGAGRAQGGSDAPRPAAAASASRPRAERGGVADAPRSGARRGSAISTQASSAPSRATGARRCAGRRRARRRRPGCTASLDRGRHAGAAAGAERVDQLVALARRACGQQLRRARCGPSAADQRADRGDAERAADHAAHRQHAGGDAGLGAVDGVHRRRAHRRHHEAHAEAHQHEGARAGSRSSCRPGGGDCQNSETATISSPTVISGRGPMRSDSRPGDRADDDDDQRRWAGSARRPRAASSRGCSACRARGRRTSRASRSVTMKATRLAPRNERERKKLKSTIGLATRRSTIDERRPAPTTATASSADDRRASPSPTRCPRRARARARRGRR